MTEVLEMGRYGGYVWSCFGLTFAVLVICIWQGRQRHRNVYRDIRMRISAMESNS